MNINLGIVFCLLVYTSRMHNGYCVLNAEWVNVGFCFQYDNSITVHFLGEFMGPFIEQTPRFSLSKWIHSGLKSHKPLPGSSLCFPQPHPPSYSWYLRTGKEPRGKNRKLAKSLAYQFSFAYDFDWLDWEPVTLQGINCLSFQDLREGRKEWLWFSSLERHKSAPWMT